MAKAKKKVVSKKTGGITQKQVHSMISGISKNFKQLNTEVNKFNKLISNYEKKTGKVLLKAKDKLKINKTVARCR
ncbi:hypothetical protein HON71_04215 [Candidatus Woesearchaeota archaeon]|jgi:hypothetical protein|nr:hypothetical protein [Candidatus Woesearchaeota archaeon]MBT5343019.1 hypothetical protein [Candidatus Woesearchaeota archaeon]